jgi:peptide-methionine (S)-S-oxide reductase
MKQEIAIFAMGCFWCGESEFRDHVKGIISISVGYAGGTKPNPTYESHEGYKEAVKIVFDPSVTSYSELLEIFWHHIDPEDTEGQFCDRGFAYAATIFVNGSKQKSGAQRTKKEIECKLGMRIETDIIAATTFYEAEEYHQNYKSKNPIRYKYYRWGSGRDQRLEDLWGNNQ